MYPIACGHDASILALKGFISPKSLQLALVLSWFPQFWDFGIFKQISIQHPAG